MGLIPILFKIMKRLITILAVVLLTTNIWAQSPQKISYQAVIRNASNTLVTSTAIGMQISILQGSSSGTAVYIETQTPTTNTNGLVSIEIGTGNVVSGTFSTIDWSAGPYFIKIETDLAGGTTYTISGTSQLLSVPYALYAKTAESTIETDPIFNASDSKNITATDITNWNNKQNLLTAGTGINITSDVISTTSGSHYIGELFGGGIVFYVYDNGQHGLISAIEDLGVTQWYNGSYVTTGAQSFYNGAANTAAIVSAQGTGNYAAKLCADYSSGGFTDWYLPSFWELNTLYNNVFVISKVLDNYGDPNTIPISHTADYWTSNDFGTNTPIISMGNGVVSSQDQSRNVFRVRPIRSF